MAIRWLQVFYDIIDRSSISKRESMMMPTPVPITEMMVAGWASRNIQPEDPTLSFYSVVKKALSKREEERPL